LRWLTCFLVFTMYTLVYSPSYAQEEGVYIIIDKSSNKLTVVLNETPVYEFPVATGKSETATPIGEFEIIRKVKNPWYIPKNIPGGDPSNPIGTRWLGIDVPGTNGYKYGIHGTNDPNSIGSYASQGCIRMRNQDVEWLFRHIPLRTKVHITP
jgi:lipoprotein-anchoring transpeptidase ErfK/SrfK